MAVTVKDFYNKSYFVDGLNAQRKYPNEELCRFMGRNYFSIPFNERRNKRILEVGCGSGANLWMLAKEGFDAYGIDLSSEAIKIVPDMLHNHNLSNEQCNISCQDMTNTTFPDNYFDAVIDVFSSYCLNEMMFNKYLCEMSRILKDGGGTLFSYTPSKNSDAFLNYAPAVLLDSSTLNGIKRKSSAYFGNNYPFRFVSEDEISNLLTKHGFSINYMEKVGRTYSNTKEYFEFIVYEASLD